MLLLAPGTAPPRYPWRSSPFERRRRWQPIATRSTSQKENSGASSETVREEKVEGEVNKATSRPEPKGSTPQTKPSVKLPDKLTPEAEGLLETIESHRATGHPALLVAQTAPAVRVALSEEFGREPGAYSPVGLVRKVRTRERHGEGLNALGWISTLQK